MERTIQFVSLARQAVAQAREQAEQARPLVEEAEANVVHQRSELAACLAVLRILHDDNLQ